MLEVNQASEIWRSAGCSRRFIDACNAVAYAHSRGRRASATSKPENIMLGPDSAKTLVVDWGVAKLLTDVADYAG